MKRTTGKYEKTVIAEETIAAFIPFPLPPKNPDLQIEDTLRALLQEAEKNLSKLELAGEMVPSLHWFIYAFVRKEAVTSSQIEGTQATLIDLLTFEAEEKIRKAGNSEVQEVCNYIDALRYSQSEISRKNGLPISVRLLNQAHGRLLKGVRGTGKQPGEIRRSQNWIGGTRPGNASFVPPPPHRLRELLGDFEKFIHDPDKFHPLIKTGLLHVQFETIHPYLDGNGRIGRLLIPLLLEHWKVLNQPLLYLSLFFKRNRSEYYDRLDKVRKDGDWEGWIQFFLRGVSEIAEEAVLLARDLFKLVSQDRQKILKNNNSTIMTLRLFDVLPLHPIVTTSKVVRLLSTTKPTALKAISTLQDLKILTESSGKKRDRTFGYNFYLNKLRSGTELRGFG